MKLIKNRSDEVLGTNSRHLEYYGVRPTDLNVSTIPEKETSLRWVFYTSCTLELWAASIMSNDNGAHWPDGCCFLKAVSKFTTTSIAIKCHDCKIVQCIPTFGQMGTIWLNRGEHVFGQWN